MQVTGKVTSKKYACKLCNYEENHSTNHYGEFYMTYCKGCGNYSTWVCKETLPKGWKLPKKWKSVDLGDVCEII